MADVYYALAIAEEAIAQLRSLPKEQRQRIGNRLTRLQDALSGDVKKLSGRENKYRLRVAISGCCSRWRVDKSRSMR